jgi:hypothetical protein
MSTCWPNLTHSFLIDCEIIRFKVKEKVIFHCAREVQQCFGGQKTILHRRYGLPDLKFLFIVELCTCVQNSIWKILGLKIQTVETCSCASSTHRYFYLKKTLKSRFLAEFQSFIFGQILAIFGSFGQFWADLGRFSCIHSGESMPKCGLKFSKPHNFSTVSPNVTCNGSLESYHPYL